jgi:hypothetical protein
MWFKWIVIVVFAVDAVFALLSWRNKKLNNPTPTGQLMAGCFYAAMAVLVFIFIK